jgi:hypothetical protein
VSEASQEESAFCRRESTTGPIVLHAKMFGRVGRCRNFPLLLLDDTGCAPSLHSRVEIKLKEVFEGYYVDCGFVVGTKHLYPGRYHDVYPRLQHGLKIARRNSFVDCGEKKPRPRVPSVTI